MDKNAIKKYAVWARRELISRVSQRAAQYEITADGYGDHNAASVHGRILTADEKKQRSALISQIKEKGYEQVMEEIAYTWFNRFSALRFMEVNGYLPTRVRVFTDDENNFKPQILTEAINMELDGLDMQKVYDLKNANDDDALFKYMIIVQCNALSKILPGMFQRIYDYTEILFPDNLLREGSVVEQMISMIPQEDWTDQVQIIGWLYQYYNSEPKDQVFANLKKNIKISKENIPAATQLFTPDWIVRYMVENSLGRLWLEGHPNDDLKAKWKYYLDEAEQEPEVQAQLAEIRKEYSALKPEQILAIDPCQGSGHILAYMFDILVQIYEAYGYSAREAAASIVEHNIWGLDIDERAAQLAYFSVMMKARQYDRRFFSRGIQPHVYAIMESNNLDPHCIEYFVDGRTELKSAMATLVKELHDAKEYGSILNVTQVDFDALYERFGEIRNEAEPNIYSYQALDKLFPFVEVAQAMAQKYTVFVTNPPYMGNKSMSSNMANYLKENYDDLKMDVFAVLMKRGFDMTIPYGMMGFMTPFVWMFISSFAKLRELIIEKGNISSLVQLEYSGFDGATVPICSFTLAKRSSEYKGEYIKLSEFRGADNQPIKTLEAISNPGCGYRYSVKTTTFKFFPESVIAFWASNAFIDIFIKYNRLDSYFDCKKGMTTGDNNKFLRLWHEVEYKKIGNRYKYYCKGGGFRRWYGNGEYVIDWIDNGQRLRSFKKATLRNESYYFKRAITWGLITSSKFSARAISNEYAIGDAGPICVCDQEYNYVNGYLNSVVATYIMDFLNPTMNFSSGVIGSLPYIPASEIQNAQEKINSLVESNVEISKIDWDSFEQSWDYKKCPLITGTTIEYAFEKWKAECEERFQRVKKNEEAINRIFIELYKLDDELDEKVEDEYVSIALANISRDIRGFISYAVGCMFGRYSLDVDGLIYAGGSWDTSKYRTFQPDKDAILPICDDEYFEDDIVGCFVKFVEIVYGKSTLEDNLRFIADALGGKGSSREVIRNYFINDFYADHLKGYQKRPIYWLFDSGKKNGFKCLIYMHRYQPDTIARIRTDYVHEQQSRYRTAIADLESRVANAGTGERVKLSKQLDAIRAQAEELRVYEEKIHHLADQMIKIDLDDGVKVNYAKFQDVLAKIR